MVSFDMDNIQVDGLLLIAWFFMIGAVIGSFLNVVVYRLPRNMSLIEPPSHCPACKHRIRWFDNIPIISWVMLRGRCRDCKAAISARYPLVEAITAGTFALITAAEFTCKGCNLPLGEMQIAENIILVTRNNWELYGIMLYHLLLLCTLLAAGLMEIDGHRAPWRLFATALLVGVLAPLAWPCLRPVHAWPTLPDSLSRVADAVAGLAAGGVLGYISRRIQKTALPGGLCWGLLCVGVFLGWQAVCSLAALIALIALAVVAFCRWNKKKAADGPITIGLYAATLGWILIWSTIVDSFKHLVHL